MWTRPHSPLQTPALRNGPRQPQASVQRKLPVNADSRILLAGIGFVDAVEGLDQITKPRVFFMALPLRLHRVTASWTRAIVLEER